MRETRTLSFLKHREHLVPNPHELCPVHSAFFNEPWNLSIEMFVTVTTRICKNSARASYVVVRVLTVIARAVHGLFTISKPVRARKRIMMQLHALKFCGTRTGRHSYYSAWDKTTSGPNKMLDSWPEFTRWKYHILVSATFTFQLQSTMTSSNGNIFRVTGPLCGEFTGPRWIPLTKASDAKLWCFPWFAPE